MVTGAHPSRLHQPYPLGCHGTLRRRLGRGGGESILLRLSLSGARRVFDRWSQKTGQGEKMAPGSSTLVVVSYLVFLFRLEQAVKMQRKGINYY